MSDYLSIREAIYRAREKLRNSDLYPYYRRVAARRQKAEVELLLERLTTESAGVDVYKDLTRQLNERRSRRRALPTVLKDVSVATFGARGWEQHGLWPSFTRTFNHVQFTDDVAVDQPLTCHTKEQRRARGERFLRFFDDRDKTHPINIVFLYCDPSNIDVQTLSALRDRGAWVVAMGLDDRHNFHAFTRGALEVGVESFAPHVDLYWTSWKAAVLLHHAIGSRAWFGGLGADPDFYRPMEEQRDLDVVFIGQSYGVRREIIWKLRKLGIDIATRGFGWPEGFVAASETNRLLSRAHIVLGISAVGAMDQVTIMKGRDFEVPMAGACYVTQLVPELGDFFQIGRDISCYSDPISAAEQIAYLLRVPDAAARMRSCARSAALLRNTWDARLCEMHAVLAGTRALDAPR